MTETVLKRVVTTYIEEYSSEEPQKRRVKVHKETTKWFPVVSGDTASYHNPVKSTSTGYL